MSLILMSAMESMHMASLLKSRPVVLFVLLTSQMVKLLTVHVMSMLTVHVMSMLMLDLHGVCVIV